MNMKLGKLGTWVAMGGVLILGLASLSWAASVSFQVKAQVPAATGVSILAYSALATDPDTLIPVVGTDLDFGTLQLDPPSGTYRSNKFFAIDVSATGGVGSPDVTAVYSETAAGNPNSGVGGDGLGKKATATFTKVTFGATPADTVVTGLGTHGPKKLLSDVNETINETEIAGGILRVYVGLVNFDPDATFPDPALGKVFTNADQPGSYYGTLLVSATVD